MKFPSVPERGCVRLVAPKRGPARPLARVIIVPTPELEADATWISQSKLSRETREKRRQTSPCCLQGRARLLSDSAADGGIITHADNAASMEEHFMSPTSARSIITT